MKGKRPIKPVAVKNQPPSTTQKALMAALIFDLLVITGIWLAKRWLPPQIPLYYGLPEGEKQLAPWWGLTLPAILSLIILGVNFFLTRLVKDDFLGKALIITAVISSVFAGYNILKIFLLVGNY